MNNYRDYNLFKYWFIRKDAKSWYVYQIPNFEKHICIYNSELHEIEPYENDSTSDEFRISSDFESFRTERPEFLIGESILSENLDHENAVEVYKDLLIGCAAIRYKGITDKNPDDAFVKIDKCIKWLDSTDFFVCPASSIYHDSVRGGLLYHSLRVVENICELKNFSKFESVSYASAVLVALVHDWCKIDRYEIWYRNVQNETTGKWEKVPQFRRKAAAFPLGHGVASYFIASRFFKLSLQEAAAIRWHMGAYNLCDGEIDEMQKCNETYPLVLLLQFADHLSITNYQP